MVRGTEIIAINGNLVSSLLTAGDFDNAWGDTSGDTTATLEILLPDASSTVSISMMREVVTIDSTQIVDTFTDTNNVKFGYLLFTNFFSGSTSITPLDAAFSFFQDEAVDQLILDLRYNGGGSVQTAVHLGGLIAGSVADGAVFTKTMYSDRYAAFNSNSLFGMRTESLSLSKVYIITTAATCSASEMLINALSPHIEVVTIGDRTCGKPVGFNPQNFCEKTINAVNFEFKNSLDVGGFFDGLQVSCTTVDDLSQALGGEQENALAIASYYQQNNQCPVVARYARRDVSALQEIGFDRRPYMAGIY